MQKPSDNEENVSDREDTKITPKQVSKETLTVIPAHVVDRLDMEDISKTEKSYTIVLDVEQPTVKPDKDPLLEFKTPDGAHVTEDVDMSSTEPQDYSRSKVEMQKQEFDVIQDSNKVTSIAQQTNQEGQETARAVKIADSKISMKSKTAKTSKTKKKEAKISHQNITEAIPRQPDDSSKSAKDTADKDVLDTEPQTADTDTNINIQVTVNVNCLLILPFDQQVFISPQSPSCSWFTICLFYFNIYYTCLFSVF